MPACSVLLKSEMYPPNLQEQAGLKNSSTSEGHLPSTKAIVFSQFWMHLQLIAVHLMRNGVDFALLKRDLAHGVKQAAVAKFQVNIDAALPGRSAKIAQHNNQLLLMHVEATESGQ